MKKEIRCVFCELPEIKNRGLIVQNNLAWAFPTNIPIVPGHLLIVPNRCVAKVEDLTASELTAIFELVFKLKPVLAKLFGATGFNFAWNDGISGGQSVPHFHLHMIPRKEGDSGILGYDPRKFLYRPGSREPSPEEELSAVARLIKTGLGE